MTGTLASLGIQTAWSDGLATIEKLTQFDAASLRAQKSSEALAVASTKVAAAARQEASATVQAMQTTLQAIQAEQKLESIRLRDQITSTGRQQSLQRLAQLGRDSLSVSKSIALAEQNAAQAQDRYNQTLTTYGTVAARGIEIQRQMAQGFQGQVNSFAGVSSVGGGPDAEDVASYGAALDALRTKFNPLYAVSKQYETALEEIAAAQRVGAIGANERAAAEENARVAFERQTVALNSAGGGFDLAGRRAGAMGGSLGQLSFQINDVVSGVLMGQKPFQIFAQQGGQIFQVWQQNPGVFKELGALIPKLLSPTVLLTGAVVGLAGGFIYLYASAVNAQKELEASLTGPGRAAGVTASQLDGMAVSAAKAANIGVGSARSIAEAYASTGKITGDQIRQLTALTADYGATTHQSIEDAAGDLAGIFSNLGTGVDTLDKKLGTLTFAQRTYIQNLIASGQNTKAVDATVAAMVPTLVHHADQLTLIGRLWADIKANASGAMNAIMVSTVATDQQLLDQANAKLAAMQASRSSPNQTAFRISSMGEINAQQAIRDQAAAKVVENAAKARAGQAAAAAKQISDLAAPIVAGVTPGFSDVQTLTNQRNSLTAMLANNAALKDSGFTLAQVKAAQEAYNFAVSSYLTPAQRAQRQTELDIQALHAKTPAQKAAVAAAQAQLQVQGQAVTADQREGQALAASTTARAAAAYQLSLQNEATRIAITGAIALAAAYGQYGAGAMVAQARTQAAQEALTSGVDVQTRTRELLTQAVANQVAGQAQDMASQLRLADVTKAANDNVAAGSLAYDRVNDFIQQHVQVLQLEDLRKAAVIAGNKTLIAQIDQMITKVPELTRAQQANADAMTRNGMLNPNASDIRNINALRGQRGGQAAIAGTSLRGQQTGLLTGLGQANPFGASGQLGLQGSIQQAQDEAAQRQKIITDAAQAGLVSAQEAADARVAIEQDANRKTLQAYQDLQGARLGVASDFFGNLASLSQSSNRTLAGIGKAAAITQATIDGVLAVQKALGAYPPPVNFAMAASVGVAAAVNVAKIAGFADGVVGINGPGSGTSDSIPAWLSNGESVVTASATNKNRNTLAAMNAGASFDGTGGGKGVQIQVIHDGSTGIQVKQLSEGRVRIIAKQAVADAKDGIVGEAVATSARLSPDWVASANKNPRRRSGVG